MTARSSENSRSESPSEAVGERGHPESPLVSFFQYRPVAVSIVFSAPYTAEMKSRRAATSSPKVNEILWCGTSAAYIAWKKSV